MRSVSAQGLGGDTKGDTKGDTGGAGVTGEARDIEWLVRWAYIDQQVRAATGSLPSIEQSSITEYGTGARVCGAMHGGLDPDAAMIQSAVEMLDLERRNLLVNCAVADRRPDWKPGARHRFEPIMKPGRRGVLRPRPIYDRSGNAVGCEIREFDPPEVVEAARRQYERWWSGLDYVARTLNRYTRLSRWMVTGPAAHKAPWTDERQISRALSRLTQDVDKILRKG